ncbi:MAG TPA: hypothetical protein VHF92_07885 [Geodermatophilus sp.]|nr:hypothetical protein [Geodermatophilus sp.]
MDRSDPAQPERLSAGADKLLHSDPQSPLLLQIAANRRVPTH